MQVINAQNVYSFILTEDEWYSGTEQQKEAWVVQCEREAKEAKCRYATILVQPDAVLSISPVAKRHKVWGIDTAPNAAENDFKRNISAAITDAYAAKLPTARIYEILHNIVRNHEDHHP